MNQFAALSAAFFTMSLQFNVLDTLLLMTFLAGTVSMEAAEGVKSALNTMVLYLKSPSVVGEAYCFHGKS